MVYFNSAAPPASSTPPSLPADFWPPPCKKARLSNHPPPQPENMTPPFASSRPPHPTTLFYKTRLCRKFLSTGTCPYGNFCSFAHGRDDIHQPMPNWQAVAPPQRSRVPGGGNAAGSRRPPFPPGLGFRGQGNFPDHMMMCDFKPSGDCCSSEERVVLPRRSAELKPTPQFTEDYLKNPGDDAPRGDLPKREDDSTPVEKSESVTDNKIFKKLAGIKKIAGIYGDWLE